MFWSILYIVMKRGRAVNGTESIALKDGDLRTGDREDQNIGKEKKKQTLQMFNLGDRATFILKDTFPQIKILLSSRIQPCLHSQLISFFSEHPRIPARVGQPAWCPCSPSLISDSHPFGALHGIEHLGSATHKQEIRWTDT